MAKKRPQADSTKNVSFEETLEAIEQIVQDLEAGQIGLDASLAKYEEGIKLLRQCHALLDKAERRIELLQEVDADGQPRTSPFDDEATLEKSPRQPAKRSTRRSTSPRPREDTDEPKGLF